ncbi:hypothetical protein AMS68_007943 [Peltaster fructicola]|uniref:Rap-GAP domain-containing protein n=1 Tax=Peltaster fructicola TaxID=286661 RepID=A0A6H0Y612_9PEZI|nr:hypothetical protein AMS68_007943 [Peltaster fructicola]
MEEKDVALSPDWDSSRSGIYKGLQSSGTSSSNLSGLHTISDSLKTGYTLDRPDVIDIHPYETTTCAQLVASIHDADRLQSVLQTAVDTLQRHAKWFSQDGLEALLQHALSKTSESNSTAEVEVALDLISTVITFAVLPLACLYSAVRFISFAYHTGARMHKHKSLAAKAWDLYQQILQSHLGGLSVAALLDLLQKEETQWSRSSFAAVSGALHLLDDKFELHNSVTSSAAITITELLPSLKNIVDHGDSILKELVIALLYKCITDHATLVDLDNTASWPILFDLVERCSDASSDIVNKGFRTRLTELSPRLEPAQLESLSKILISANHDLPREAVNYLIRPTKVVVRLTDPEDSVSQHDRLLKLLQPNPRYNFVLAKIAQNDADLLRLCEDPKDWTRLLQTYMDLISSKDLQREGAMICAEFLCTVYHHAFSTSNLTTKLWKVDMVFNAITKLAFSAPRREARRYAFRALARLRVTINGYVYLEEDESWIGTNGKGTEPGVVLLSDLPRERWLDEVLALMRDSDVEQNKLTASFVLEALPAQLGNLHFFVDQRDHVRAIYDIAIHKLASPKDTHAVSYIRILTSLVNYKGLFSHAEERQMVELFIIKAGSSEAVSKECIHALTLCCYELADTVARNLDHVVQKMAQMITQKHLSIHVLEFMTGLSRLPSLFRNFRSDDFRKIFGVCISYLQSIRSGHISQQAAIGSDAGSGSQPLVHEVLPQYVYALAHHVMIFWYLVLRADDRQLIKTYVTNSLCYRREGDKDVPDDQGLVVIDFMERVDTESTAQRGPRALAEGDMDEIFDDVDGKIMVQHRICGLVLISTHTSMRTAKTLVTTRRPSGTARYLVFGRNPVTRESWTSTYITAAPASVWSGSAGDDDTMTVYSDDADGSSYGAISIPSSSSPLGAAGIVILPDEPALERAIQAFDRIPGLDSHKAGVIYIGEGQMHEDDILANSSGSPDYRDIVAHLGNLQKLQDAKFNTQGLDTHHGADGSHVIVWNNDLTELVFHITTMMPTDIKEKKMSAIRKKAHIGNDHVNIIFNNSGMPFRRDTFPSQFSSVYIVITPSVRTTFLQTRTHTVNTAESNRFYKVEVLTKEDFPAISSAAEPKMISGASLAGYVRNLALNACIFAEVWINRDSEDYKSSWRHRLSQIRRLRERYAPENTSDRPSSVVSKGKGKSHFWK